MMTNEENAKFDELLKELGDTPGDKEIAHEMVQDILKKANQQTQGLMALFAISKKAWENSNGELTPEELIKTILSAVQLCGVELKLKNVNKALKNCGQIDDIAYAVNVVHDDECKGHD